MSLPKIAINMGDGAGIGPDIIMSAVHSTAVTDVCVPVLIGDARRLRAAAELRQVPADLRVIADPTQAGAGEGVSVIDLALLPDDLPWGALSAAAGDAAYRYVERAGELARWHGRRHLHRAAEQGGTARRRPPVPGTHGATRRAMRDTGGVDDAVHRSYERHSRDHPYGTCRCDRGD